MLTRANAEASADYEARFKQAQDAKNSETALTYESITAPFIEQTGLNLLKKGSRFAGKKLGISDEDLDSLGSIADKIKGGDIGAALDKARLMGQSKLVNPEQENFLKDQLNKFTQLKEGTTKLPSFSQDVPDADIQLNPISASDFSSIDVPPEEEVSSQLSKPQLGDMFSSLSGGNKGVSFSMLSKPSPRPLVSKPNTSADSLDPLDIQFENINPFSGRTITKPKPSIKTNDNQVFDENGKPLEDVESTLRNKLEYTDETFATGPEIEQNKRELAEYIGKTEAPQEPNAYQSAMSFLKGEKGTTSASWGKNRLEAEDVSNLKPTNTPTTNPADFAPDIEVNQRDLLRGMRRGQDIRITSKKSTEPVEPVSAEPTGVAPEEVDRILGQGDEPKQSINETDIQKKFSKLSQEGRENYIDDVTDEAEKANTSAKEVPLETKNSILDEHLSTDQLTGRGLADPNIEGTVQEVKSIKGDLTGRYNDLSQSGKDLADEAGESLADQYSIKRSTIPMNRLENILSVSEEQEKPPTVEPEQEQKSEPEPEDKPPIETEDKPPVELDDSEPSLGSKVVKASEEAGETVAEGGGIEDPITDIIALGGALGALFSGLHKAHETSQPPPLLQVNPTLQLGQGQV